MRFTQDNTEGYTNSQLADLNAAYSVRLSELRCQGVDVDDNKSLCDKVAERLLADADDALAGRVTGYPTRPRA